MSEHNFNREPTKLHGAALSDYAIERIDEGIEEVTNISIEQSLMHAVMVGRMTIEEAMECIAAYERTFISHDS